MFILRGKSIFHYYFWSYVFICSIPILIMGFFFYSNSIQQLKEEIEQSNISKLTQVKNLIDQRINELHHITARISDDKMLSPVKFNSSKYDAIEAVYELNKYKANSSIIEDLYLYIRGGQTIYSSSGTFDYTYFERYFYRYDEDESRFFKDLNQLTSSEVRLMQEIRNKAVSGVQALSFMYPLSHYSTNPFGTLIYAVKLDVLNLMLDNILGEFQGESYIFDNHGQQIAFSHSGKPVQEVDLAELLLRYAQTGAYKTDIHGTPYSFIHVRSETTDWSFVALVPSKQFAAHIIQASELGLAAFVFAIIMAICFAFFFARFNTKPIRRLAGQLKANWKAKDVDTTSNELDQIGKLAAHAVNSHREILKEQFIYKLLNGKVKHNDELEQLLQYAEFEFHGKYFYVMKVAQSDVNITHFKDTLFGLLEDSDVRRIAQVYGVETIHEDSIAVIVNVDSKERTSESQRRLGHLMQDLMQQKLGSVPHIGIGSFYSEFMNINSSYIEASAALEYISVNGRRNLVLFEDMKHPEPSQMWYPMEDQLRLLQSLKQGDSIVAKDNIGTIVDRISTRGNSLLMLKYVSIDIANSVIKCVKQIHPNHFIAEIDQLMKFNSVEQLNDSLVLLSEKVCEYVQAAQESRSQEIKEGILAFVNQNFCDPALSLEQLSEQCKMSLSFVSKIFKEHAGCTYMDYVTGLRLNEAKRQLLETSAPIKDIVMNVGYIDLPNFVRKFKNIEGITPGQFRKLYAPSKG